MRAENRKRVMGVIRRGGEEKSGSVGGSIGGGGGREMSEKMDAKQSAQSFS